VIQISVVIATLYVTGPAKTGHVGSNYTPSLYRLFSVMEKNMCVL